MTKEDDMHVRFTANFDYTPSEDRRSTIAYKKGFEGSVRRECGEAAIAEKKAEEIVAPAREEAETKGKAKA
ncbi:MAG: hypothetical protein EOP20_07140 [Hyphomicrobiales bacterium]|nr:MAG: hypothetical protein EOP20_07140 [Hyphomicrobiales bacterium]